MRRAFNFLILISLTGCTALFYEEPKIVEVDVKYCIAVCRAYEFGNFHNGTSMGGSSSMNGLTQAQIFDRVTKSCEDFYAKTKCCEGYDTVRRLHNYRYGECK